jgi:hypothetical protein
MGQPVNTKYGRWRSMIPKVWTDLGDDVKRIRNELVTLICKREYQDVLTKKETEPLSKALRYVDQFRSRAEDRMATKIDGSKVSDKEFLGVFYGD